MNYNRISSKIEQKLLGGWKYSTLIKMFNLKKSLVFPSTLFLNNSLKGFFYIPELGSRNLKSENTSFEMESKNVTDKGLAKMNELFIRLKKSEYDASRVLKLESIYGSWGMEYAFQYGFFLNLLPPIVTIIMFVVFKRKKLVGVTQKFIMSIMVTDLLYTSISNIRDTLLRVFQMHFGFMEYRVCAEIIVSFRVQMFFYATSVWLKTLMLLHQVLLVGFPLKVKQHNMSNYFYIFSLVHVTLFIIFLLFQTTPVFEPVPLIQEFRPGYPLREIIGCRYSHSKIFNNINVFQVGIAISTVMLMYNQILPFVFHLITIVALVIFLTKHIRTLTVLTNNIAVERIKYIVLMKVNIGLGLSFILQEMPLIISLLLQIGISENIKESNIEATGAQFQGYTTVLMSISFCIGKPIDLLIYCSLSKAFKEELKYLLMCFCRPCRRKVSIEERNCAQPRVPIQRPKKVGEKERC